MAPPPDRDDARASPGATPAAAAPHEAAALSTDPGADGAEGPDRLEQES